MKNIIDDKIDNLYINISIQRKFINKFFLGVKMSL